MGHFHMTKYSSVLKAKIVTEYQRGGISSNALAKKYNIYDGSQVRRWARQAEADGLMSIKVKHIKRTYTQQFKLTVLDYVQINGVTGDKLHNTLTLIEAKFTHGQGLSVSKV